MKCLSFHDIGCGEGVPQEDRSTWWTSFDDVDFPATSLLAPFCLYSTGARLKNLLKDKGDPVVPVLRQLQKKNSLTSSKR